MKYHATHGILYVQYSSIAQSVEHSAVNRSVVGSSPTGGAIVLGEVLSSLVRSLHRYLARSFRVWCEAWMATWRGPFEPSGAAGAI